MAPNHCEDGDGDGDSKRRLAEPERSTGASGSWFRSAASASGCSGFTSGASPAPSGDCGHSASSASSVTSAIFSRWRLFANHVFTCKHMK